MSFDQEQLSAVRRVLSKMAAAVVLDGVRHNWKRDTIDRGFAAPEPRYRGWWLADQGGSVAILLNHTEYSRHSKGVDPAWRIMLRFPATEAERPAHGSLVTINLAARIPSPLGDKDGLAEAQARAVRAWIQIKAQRDAAQGKG